MKQILVMNEGHAIQNCITTAMLIYACSVTFQMIFAFLNLIWFEDVLISSDLCDLLVRVSFFVNSLSINFQSIHCYLYVLYFKFNVNFIDCLC